MVRKGDMWEEGTYPMRRGKGSVRRYGQSGNMSYCFCREVGGGDGIQGRGVWQDTGKRVLIFVFHFLQY